MVNDSSQETAVSDPETATETPGAEMFALIERLYPICRSITGDGVRESLRILSESVPMQIREVPTGTEVFDWEVPREWNIRDAYIKDGAGNRIVDFRECNLHVVSYSSPVRRKMRLAELRDHLFTAPQNPDWIPYLTSYYDDTWGFCLSQNQLSQFSEDEEYEVCIDASLENGSLTYGEFLIKGKQPEEVLVSTHICHPSMCNDNLSGISLSIQLAKFLGREPRRYSYRFVFVPATIGAITWLAQNESSVDRIRHGMVLTCVGDPGSITYKKTRRGDAEIDRAFAHVLRQSGDPHEIIEYFPFGYDERQYCSPGFDLPVCCFMRTPHGQFPGYHSSGDDLQSVSAAALTDSFEKCAAAINVLENNRTYINLSPKCEPRLGKRGLYTGLDGQDNLRRREMALLWALNLSDGGHSLLDIAERAGLPFDRLRIAAEALSKSGLMAEKGA